MNSACCKRRAKRAGKLVQRLSIDSLTRLVLQDEKGFSLQVPSNCQNNRVYFNGPKKDVQPEHLYREGNKFSKKVMVSAVINWKGVSQNFFIGGNGIKEIGASYLKPLRDNLIPAIEAMYPNKDFSFVQDSAPSNRANQVQNFLNQKLESRFVKNTDWPSKSPDCNPLDYYFWDRVQEKVYNGRYCYPFATNDELKRRIRDVWDECATDLPQIRKAMKQFFPRLEAVDAKEGGSIKTVFGFYLFIYLTSKNTIVISTNLCRQKKKRKNNE